MICDRLRKEFDAACASQTQGDSQGQCSVSLVLILFPASS